MVPVAVCRSVCRAVTTLGFVALLTATVHASGPVFVWSDDQGTLHATDRLQDVPEPYFSMYNERIADMKKHGQDPYAVIQDDAPASVAHPPSSYAPAADDVARQRQVWRDTLKRWRQELQSATIQLQNIQNKRDEKALNPIFRTFPGARESIAELDDELVVAKRRMLVARQMLTDGLPKKARDEHVPPQWLL